MKTTYNHAIIEGSKNFRMENAIERASYYKKIKKFLMSTSPCISMTNEAGESHMVLTDTDQKPIVIFDKQIGAASYGLAYINFGIEKSSKNKLITFSCKITETFQIETNVMTALTDYVILTQFPNFPLMYAYLLCDNVNPDLYNYFPPLPDKKRPVKQYTIICSELADCDLKKWLKLNKALYISVHKNIISQMLLAIYKLHKLGYAHDDLHPGNMLIHNVDTGGFWRYKIDETIVDIPNLGYILVLWDFGQCKKISKNNYGISDYTLSLRYFDIDKLLIKCFEDLFAIKDKIQIAETQALLFAHELLKEQNIVGKQINSEIFVM